MRIRKPPARRRLAVLVGAALVTAALASPELTRADLRPALAGAKKANNPEILALVEKKLASMPAEPPR